MRIPSLCFKFVFVLSLSFTASSYSSFVHRTFPFPSLSIKASTHPKATPSDLLSILGSREDASKIDIKEADEFKSCLKFLVPFSPNVEFAEFGRFTSQRRDLLSGDVSDRSKSNTRMNFDRSLSEEDELVLWPPAPVMELARLAVDSGGDPAAIHRALDPTVLPVPDVEGCKEHRCELTRTPYGRRFINEDLNSYLAFLFEIIAARGPSVGLNVSLNRFDLFHGHLFLANETGRLGILFHAREYPAYEKEVFPYNMGFCQRGSNVAYDDSMNLRNILWLAPLPSTSTKAWVAPGVLVVLDAHPGGIIYKDLIPEYVDFVRTIYEDDFGVVAVDVNYFNVGEAVPDRKIFIC